MRNPGGWCSSLNWVAVIEKSGRLYFGDIILTLDEYRNHLALRGAEILLESSTDFSVQSSKILVQGSGCSCRVGKLARPQRSALLPADCGGCSNGITT